jgi:hypothetical protein
MLTMWQEIKKELLTTVTEGSKKLIRLGAKLMIFVMACWITIGALVIGIVAPVSVFKSMSSPKEIGKIRIAEPVPDVAPKTVQSEPSVSMISYRQPRSIQPNLSIRTNLRKPDFRAEIRETRGVVSEIRRFGDGLKDFVTA